MKAYRAALAHCTRHPVSAADDGMLQTFDDGLLVVEDGLIVAVGAAVELLPGLKPDTLVTDWRGKIIVPGFVDSHVHAAQLDVIASPGRDLLDWLERFTFPAEAAFADGDHATLIANLFLDELLKNGTTSAFAWPTVHKQSADALFAAAHARNLRLITGKVLMDRNCPDNLRDTEKSGAQESADLIAQWHGKGRLSYAITPRFALTSTEAQLHSAGDLLHSNPGVFMQTHLAENHAEIVAVLASFPKARSYLDVYENFGLLGGRSVFAHCIHLSAEDRARMLASASTAAHCPTSNLFLGSGLMDLRTMLNEGLPVSLASDVGGGTSFSMLATMAAAYQVAQLRGGWTPSVATLLYLATLAGARAMGAEAQIGSFAPGKEADFAVLDCAATPLIARRCECAPSLAEKLFALITLGDDRAVKATYVLGHAASVPTKHA